MVKNEKKVYNMNFKYFENRDAKLSDLAKVQAIIKAENIILDSKYLPVIEQAENGNFTAMAELATMFSEGTENVKPNYNLAKRYIDKALEIVRTSNVKSSVLEVLTNSAVLESNFGNVESAKEHLKEAFNIVLDNYTLHSTIGNISSFFHFIVENEEVEES